MIFAVYDPFSLLCTTRSVCFLLLGSLLCIIWVVCCVRYG